MSLACRFREYIKQEQGYKLSMQTDCEISENVLQNILASKPYHEALGGIMKLRYKNNKLQQITCISCDKQIKRVYNFI